MRLAGCLNRARDYVALHKIVENWTEDDDAPLISFDGNVVDEIADSRRTFIVDAAAAVAKARARALGWFRGGAARNRLNVVGSYYIKLEYPHNPWFVLTKHPDHDLKMAAWLTVLTTLFGFVMEA